MSTSVTRRDLLRVGAGTGALALAGCLDVFGSSERGDGVLVIQSTDRQPLAGSILTFSTLPAAEQALVEQALEKNVLRLCLTDKTRGVAFKSFAERPRQVKTYLRYNDKHYAMYLRRGDREITNSAPAPKDDVNPCR
ncbi:hypothetical protein [Haloarchaeobius sp. DFWS5]|uniref:hypothetical protein n=1 Tax=Haloarchaeobius sp. DFWS5 TaxID=3446114 RepID=UPI003EBDCEA3